METGNLPSDSGAIKAGSGPAESVPTVKYAGNIYRIALREHESTAMPAES